MIRKGKDTVVGLLGGENENGICYRHSCFRCCFCHDFSKDKAFEDPVAEVLRKALRLREAWKLYAIAQREQVERLEKLIEFYKTGDVLNRQCSAYIESETIDLKTDIENGDQTVEILRHAVVMAGDGD